MTRDRVEKEFVALLSDAATRLGRRLGGNAQELTKYAGERARHLAGLVGQPGFEEALTAERDNLVLMAGGLLIEAGDAADAELVGIIGGALGMAARLLA